MRRTFSCPVSSFMLLVCTLLCPKGSTLLLPGAPLWVILAAGEWTSPAFLKYLDLHRLEADMVIQAHVDESDGEPE